MKKENFINQVAKRLDAMNLQYQTGINADISISTNLRTGYDDHYSKTLTYFALILLKEDSNIVYAYERAVVDNEDITRNSDYAKTIVKNDNDDVFAIGAILGAVAYISSTLGFIVVKTDNESGASYPTETTPLDHAGSFEGDKKIIKKFCTNCGTRIIEGSRFCTNCGVVLQQETAPQIQSFNTPHPVFNTANTSNETNRINANIPQITASKKLPLLPIALVSLMAIGIIIAAVVVFVNRKKDDNIRPKPEQTSLSKITPAPTGKPSTVSNKISPAPTSQSSTASKKITPAPAGQSSVVSKGVSTLDLGNIVNGQYYFATDEYIFYSSFDKNNKAHIYSAKKDGTNHKAIFDGFGWSLVVIDKWLYFSGNQGEKIDGTYNLFRISFDGSKIEKINNEYSYGMCMHNNKLYYMKRHKEYQHSMSLYRSNLDGSNEEMLFPYGYSPLICDNKLYRFDNQGNMLRTDTDGKNTEVLLAADVDAYVLSGGKIVYKDHNNNICVCDLDAKNHKIIRKDKGMPINAINAYNGRIFFSEYDSKFNYASYGYNYTVKSCNMDGSDEKTVYSSVSYGTYINIVNNKLMLLDYVRNSSTETMFATIKSMNLDGSGLKTLDR